MLNAATRDWITAVSTAEKIFTLVPISGLTEHKWSGFALDMTPLEG